MTTLKLQNHKYIVNHNGEEREFDTLVSAWHYVKSIYQDKEN